MSNIDKHAELRKELSNPATGSNHHLRKLALALMDELEASEHTAAVDHEAACSLVEENEEVKRKLAAAEKRIAELEARTVTLPAQKFCPGEYMDSVLWSETEVWNQAISECAKAIRAAGIGKGE